MVLKLKTRHNILKEPLSSFGKLIYNFWKYKVAQQTFVGLQDVFETSSRHVLKTSSTRPQRNNFSSSKTSWRRLANTSRGRLEDVLKTSRKTSWKLLGRQKNVTLKTSSRHLEDMSWRRLEDDLETNKMFTGDMYLTMDYQQI